MHGAEMNRLDACETFRNDKINGRILFQRIDVKENYIFRAVVSQQNAF